MEVEETPLPLRQLLNSVVVYESERSRRVPQTLRRHFEDGFAKMNLLLVMCCQPWFRCEWIGIIIAAYGAASIVASLFDPSPVLREETVSGNHLLLLGFFMYMGMHGFLATCSRFHRLYPPNFGRASHLYFDYVELTGGQTRLYQSFASYFSFLTLLGSALACACQDTKRDPWRRTYVYCVVVEMVSMLVYVWSRQTVDEQTAILAQIGPNRLARARNRALLRELTYRLPPRFGNSRQYDTFSSAPLVRSPTPPIAAHELFSFEELRLAHYSLRDRAGHEASSSRNGRVEIEEEEKKECADKDEHEEKKEETAEHDLELGTG